MSIYISPALQERLNKENDAHKAAEIESKKAKAPAVKAAFENFIAGLQPPTGFQLNFSYTQEPFKVLKWLEYFVNLSHGFKKIESTQKPHYLLATSEGMLGDSRYIVEIIFANNMTAQVNCWWNNQLDNYPDASGCIVQHANQIENDMEK